MCMHERGGWRQEGGGGSLVHFSHASYLAHEAAGHHAVVAEGQVGQIVEPLLAVLVLDEPGWVRER